MNVEIATCISTYFHSISIIVLLVGVSSCGGMYVCTRAMKVYFLDRKSTRLNSSHANISYAVFCLKKKTSHHNEFTLRSMAGPENTGLVHHVLTIRSPFFIKASTALVMFPPFSILSLVCKSSLRNN